jgi:hypothetical protein
MILVYADYDAKRYGDIISILKARNQAAESADTSYQLAQTYALMNLYAEAKQTILDMVQHHPETAAAGSAFLSQLGMQP